MGKKFMNTVLFLLVAVAAATLTAYVGKGSGNVLFYNFAFLGIMVIIYAVGLFAGLYRMDNLTTALKHGASEITDVFQLPGRAKKEEIGQLRGIFGDRYLDKKMDDFVDSISRTEEGKSGGYYVFVVPIEKEVDRKAAAKSVGEKTVDMIHVKDLTKITGYIRGGCSPLGMKKNYPVVFDQSAENFEEIYVSGGRVGLTLKVPLKDLLDVTQGKLAPITME